MGFDNYKFVLKTYESSENEVTGEDIDLVDRFECDLKGVNLKEGVSLFSPKKEEWKQYGIEKLIFPDFNFKVLEVHKDGVVLETSFQYSSYSSQFKISYAEPKHRESICFGRYCYSYELTFVKR
ncbi:MAG: hypothetical protein IJB38_00215 [Bacteroidales bacterium]|nr:hypothetical protein [Bacteroidales bacterium]